MIALIDLVGFGFATPLVSVLLHVSLLGLLGWLQCLLPLVAHVF